MKRPESAAFTPTGNNEVSKVDLAKVEEDRLKGNASIGKPFTAVFSTTTIIQFDDGDDDSEDSIADLGLNALSQTEAGQASLQEQEDSYFSSGSVDDKIPLI